MESFYFVYSKNGLFVILWEIMSMLLCDSAEYMEQPKLAWMIDLLLMRTVEEAFPAGKPKVVNISVNLA